MFDAPSIRAHTLPTSGSIFIPLHFFDVLPFPPPPQNLPREETSPRELLARGAKVGIIDLEE